MTQFKNQLGFEAYIDEKCQTYMQAFFTLESITLPTLSEVFCNPEDLKSRLYPYHGPFKELVTDKKWLKGKLIEFYPPKKGYYQGGYRPSEHVSDEQNMFNKAYVRHFHENMVFRDNLKEKIHKRLKDIAKEYYNKRPKYITYVGIHIRRTDYLKFAKNYYGLDPLTKDYFNDAMEYFKEEYKNCMFIVASDDIKWAKENLDKENNKIYFSDQDPKFHKPPSDAEFEYEIVDNDLSKAAYDFALLTSCNHTISSRGSFSVWIAHLTPQIVRFCLFTDLLTSVYSNDPILFYEKKARLRLDPDHMLYIVYHSRADKVKYVK